jgi:hypothetical protein
MGPKQKEHLGIFLIVNAGLWVFFLGAYGTAILPVIITTFWGMGLALDLWRSYLSGSSEAPNPEPADGLKPPVWDRLKTKVQEVRHSSSQFFWRGQELERKWRQDRFGLPLAVLVLISSILAVLPAAAAAILVGIENEIVGNREDFRIAQVALVGTSGFFALFALFFSLTNALNVWGRRALARGRLVGRVAAVLAIVAMIITVAVAYHVEAASRRSGKSGGKLVNAASESKNKVFGA